MVDGDTLSIVVFVGASFVICVVVVVVTVDKSVDSSFVVKFGDSSIKVVCSDKFTFVADVCVVLQTKMRMSTKIKAEKA